MTTKSGAPQWNVEQADTVDAEAEIFQVAKELLAELAKAAGALAGRGKVEQLAELETYAGSIFVESRKLIAYLERGDGLNG